MLEDALDITEGPVAIRWPKTPAPQVEWTEVGTGMESRKVTENTDKPKEVCILAAGKMLSEALTASEELKEVGVTVWDPRIINPLNLQMLEDAKKHKLVVTIEDGYIEGGFGSSVLSHLNQEKSDCRVVNLGVPLSFHSHNKPDHLLSSFGLDSSGIVKSIRQAISEFE
jgi:1-deoxy-D-xylulose-5-phosphate synthase